jgi:tetratricopeptide (TPR) repeat protein
MLGVTAIGGVARFVVLAREYPALSFHPRFILLELDVLRRYLQLLVFPSGQSIFHSVPLPGADWRGVVAIAFGALLGAAIWTFRRQAWPVSFGLSWFVLLLMPGAVLAFFNEGEPLAEHRVYLASCGLWLAAGYAIQAIWAAAERRRSPWPAAAAGAGVLLIAALGAETLIRNSVWSDPVDLWRESVDLAPRHYWPRLLLGEALEDAGRRPEAVKEYQESIRLNPSAAAGHVKLGNALVQQVRLDEARREFQKALDVDPADGSARRALAALDRMEQTFGIDRGR